MSLPPAVYPFSCYPATRLNQTTPALPIAYAQPVNGQQLSNPFFPQVPVYVMTTASAVYPKPGIFWPVYVERSAGFVQQGQSIECLSPVTYSAQACCDPPFDAQYAPSRTSLEKFESLQRRRKTFNQLGIDSDQKSFQMPSTANLEKASSLTFSAKELGSKGKKQNKNTKKLIVHHTDAVAKIISQVTITGINESSINNKREVSFNFNDFKGRRTSTFRLSASERKLNQNLFYLVNVTFNPGTQFEDFYTNFFVPYSSSQTRKLKFKESGLSKKKVYVEVLRNHKTADK